MRLVPTYTADKAIDGDDPDTRWATDQNTDQNQL